MLTSVDVNDLRHALGGVVLEAAYLERVLRAAFSALVGSKYAAVVDGRLMAAALIEDCEQITRYHTGITEPATTSGSIRAASRTAGHRTVGAGRLRHGDLIPAERTMVRGPAWACASTALPDTTDSGGHLPGPERPASRTLRR
jgi:hypothetical protein